MTQKIFYFKLVIVFNKTHYSKIYSDQKPLNQLYIKMIKAIKFKNSICFKVINHLMNLWKFKKKIKSLLIKRN